MGMWKYKIVQSPVEEAQGPEFKTQNCKKKKKKRKERLN
jgi:hypothetical protein